MLYYYWFLCFLKLVKPVSLNRCFIRWTETVLPEKLDGLTVSFDEKIVHSTGHISSYESPLLIVSAQISELGMTFAQKSVDGKSNEIPAVRELINQLEIHGCIVVADAMNCQKKTARAIIAGSADLSAVCKGQPGNPEKGYRGLCAGQSFPEEHRQGIQNVGKPQQD